ncbi:MAG: zinc ribbon domain-containing protein, partial [Acetobacteraceae bacterium]|nr:zinc ribbon domain-containing protein [Acetobacteraceae bacterium]
MNCPACQAEAGPGARFCSACGASLPAACSRCGAVAAPGAQFCAQCGSFLEGASVPPPSSAERRQITVMFCDLAGSTALAARLDPEDMRDILAGYRRCVAEAVAHYHGFVAKYMGDGVLAYFGYPQGHEDDAERAVRASIATVGAIRELSSAEKLHVHIGIASGLVVAGDLIGSGPAQEQTIVGETPNLAARLQVLAGPDEIVISESTKRQIGGLFQLADRGLQQLKGFAAPQRAWRVLAENRALSRFEALRSRNAPLVGRDAELALLLRAWTQAKAGAGQAVLISGEPGV